MYVLAIDIGGTAVKIGIVTQNGKLLSSKEYSVFFDEYKTPVITTVLQSIDSFLSETQTPTSVLSGIGVSATGQIDTCSGSIAGVCGNIPDYENLNIKESFEKKYNLRTMVINDANSAALAEFKVGNANGYKNVIVITIGTGIGGGIIVNSGLLQGSRGFGGEIGHFPININGKMCTCKNRGCYEQYASMTALIHMVKSAVKNNPDYAAEDINGITIFGYAEKKDVLISSVVQEWIGNVAAGLIGLTHIFNPELILIGGGISKQETLFINPLREKIFDGLMPQFAQNLEIRNASLGNTAGMIGAALHFCEQL